MRGLFVALVLLMLIGCSGPSAPSYATPRIAVQEYFQSPVQVYQESESAFGRLVIIEVDRSPAPMAVLVERVGTNRWRMWSGYDAGPLRNIGAVSLHLKHMGKVEERAKPPAEAVTLHPKVTVLYGVVNDPRITWVEVELPDDSSAGVKRVPVINGTWVVDWPWRSEYGLWPRTSLRAGNDTGERFSVPNVWNTPLVGE